MLRRLVVATVTVSVSAFRSFAAPAPAVNCAALATQAGDWERLGAMIPDQDAKSGKCKQNYLCSSKKTLSLTKEQAAACRAVTKPSPYIVPVAGKCVAGSKPGECKSCTTSPPTETCNVYFIKIGN
jgi:hypothetical protein